MSSTTAAGCKVCQVVKYVGPGDPAEVAVLFGVVELRGDGVSSCITC